MSLLRPNQYVLLSFALYRNARIEHIDWLGARTEETYVLLMTNHQWNKLIVGGHSRQRKSNRHEKKCQDGGGSTRKIEVALPDRTAFMVFGLD